MRITNSQAVDCWVADTDVYLSKHQNMNVYTVHNKYTDSILGHVDKAEARDFLVLRCGEKEDEN